MKTKVTTTKKPPSREKVDAQTGDSFRLHLQAEFVRRCRDNPQYSLRAFARQLQVDQSLLSKILRGHRTASDDLVQKVGLRLGLSPVEMAKFSSAESQFSQMAEDTFGLLGDWYHFAILELLKLPSCRHETNWIASRLSIHPTEAVAALERLERLGYVTQKRKKWVILNPNNTWHNTALTTAARRNLQRSLLQKALTALEEVPFEARENGSLTLAVDQSLMPEIKVKLKAFRAELDHFAQSKGNYNHVYQLVLAFFPLSTLEN